MNHDKFAQKTLWALPKKLLQKDDKIPVHHAIIVNKMGERGHRIANILHFERCGPVDADCVTFQEAPASTSSTIEYGHSRNCDTAEGEIQCLGPTRPARIRPINGNKAQERDKKRSYR